MGYELALSLNLAFLLHRKGANPPSVGSKICPSIITQANPGSILLSSSVVQSRGAQAAVLSFIKAVALSLIELSFTVHVFWIWCGNILTLFWNFRPLKRLNGNYLDEMCGLLSLCYVMFYLIVFPWCHSCICWSFNSLCHDIVLLENSSKWWWLITWLCNSSLV